MKTEQPVISDLYADLERACIGNGYKSIRNVRSAWNRHLQEHFGSCPVRKFSSGLVQSFILKRRKAGAMPATINRELAVLKRMASFALQDLKYSDDDLIGALMQWSKVKQLEESNTRKGFVSPSQYQSLARETARFGMWLRGIFECAYAYGLRKGELLSMRVSQIHLSAQTVTLQPGKSGEPRVLVLSPKILRILRKCIRRKHSNDLVFTRMIDSANRKSKIGGRIADFRDLWATACKRAGVDVRFNDLRRTAVANMLSDGMDEKGALTISGNKTRNMLDRYNIVRPSTASKKPSLPGRKPEPEEAKTYYIIGQRVEKEIPIKRKDDKYSIIAARRLVAEGTHLEYDVVAQYHMKYRRRCRIEIPA